MESPVLLFILIALVVVALAVIGAIQAKKRRDAMAGLATRLGLSYRRGRDRGLASRFGFLNRLATGSNRYAENVIDGEYGGHRVFSFDYHYETYSTDSKGNRQTQHHYFSCFLLLLPGRFPELTITHEGLLSKFAQALGFDDIDFESGEFSRRFCVRSRDKKFAYDVCHARMMEYLLGNQDLCIEIENDTLAVIFHHRLKVELIESNLQRLVELRRLLPDYLFANQPTRFPQEPRM